MSVLMQRELSRMHFVNCGSNDRTRMHIDVTAIVPLLYCSALSRHIHGIPARTRYVLGCFLNRFDV